MSSKAPWFVAPKGGPSGPFHGIVNGQGRVIAAMVPDSEDAALIVSAPKMKEEIQAALLTLDLLIVDDEYSRKWMDAQLTALHDRLSAALAVPA